MALLPREPELATIDRLLDGTHCDGGGSALIGGEARPQANSLRAAFGLAAGAAPHLFHVALAALELLRLEPARSGADRVSAAPAPTPDTIVLIHGFWVTARSWENWKSRYEARGYRVLTPAYPGFEVEVEALNADPSPIEKVTVPQIIESLETLIGGLDAAPILMGHSAGGTYTQILLDHGFGAAGVAINSAPTEGVRVTPWSQIRSTFPVLKNPANRHRPVGLTHEQWRYAFTNTFSEEESRVLYERYHVPASGNLIFGSVLANLKPGHQETWVDYENDDRAPLLFASGGEDHLMPPKVQRSNAKRYKSDTVTEVKEFEGFPHLLPAYEGWEEVADYALSWAVEHAAQPTAA